MKIKGVSFSKYKAKINTYIFEKLSLFEFLFIQILLDSNIDRKKKIKDCLLDLDMKEDLHYLFNNVYYKLIDNLIIGDNQSEDITNLKIEDIIIDERFIKYLNEGYFPILNGSIEKEFIYDYLKNKVVLEKDIFTDSDVCLFRVNNDRNSIEQIINDNKKGLLDIDNGVCILEELIIDPYYFNIDLNKEKNEYILDCVKENSLYLNDLEIKGEFLANNVYYSCLYSNRDMSDYCDILFEYNKEREFEVDDKIIYVGYEFEDNDYIDLKNKEAYRCGKCMLDNYALSTYLKHKIDISEFKLYLIKNKNRFKTNISKYIELF